MTGRGQGTARARAARLGCQALGLLAACGPRVEPATADTSTATTVSTAAPATSTTTTSPSTSGEDPGKPGGVSSHGGSGTTGGSTGPRGAEPGWIVSDGGGQDVECSLWDQDCPAGDKCVSWAILEGREWNATKCAPLDPMPAQPGDPCTIQGSPTSGIDDCDEASICWNPDPTTFVGTCVPFCIGPEGSPQCGDPQTTCTIANDGVLIPCLADCDPLAPVCPEREGCYLVGAAVVCAPDASGPTGVYGDPCVLANDCDPGLACIAAGVPGCSGPFGCCSPVCDLSDPAADAGCPGAAQGQVCVAAFVPGMAPAGQEHLGICSAYASGPPEVGPYLERPL